MGTIYLLRHGETKFNEEGRYQGILDSSLTQKGLEQVENIAWLLKTKEKSFEEFEFYSSPLGRAVETTKLICKKIEYDYSKVKFKDDLSEIDTGAWNGTNYQERKKKWPNNLQGTDNFNWYFHSPDGENFEDAFNRILGWITSINDKDAIVVTHGLTSRLIRGAYLKQEKDEMLKLDVSQNSFFKLIGGRIEQFIFYED